ncbi:MAG: disulfide bond formation protein B, partial [Alphaproteobacteria bacterium]|nr:disulfide bond formation protein B [Alphaproteobacteria bacterium]
MDKWNDHAMTILFWVTGSLVTLSLFLEHIMGLSPCYLCLKERSIHMILCVASLILMRAYPLPDRAVILRP